MTKDLCDGRYCQIYVKKCGETNLIFAYVEEKEGIHCDKKENLFFFFFFFFFY